MAGPDVAALAARAVEIAEATVTTQAAIVAQQGKARRSQRWLAGSLVFDLLITGGLIFTSHQACEQGNQFRAKQVALWDHVIAVSRPPPGETPAQRAARLATLAAFRAYIGRQFAPVNCTRP